MNTNLPDELHHRVATLLASGRRQLLGLVGTPGSGKSTVAEGLLAAYPGQVRVVPMDGYHLANSELARLGRAGRKGAEDTFDSAGYAALLQRLRGQAAGETVYAPEFRREIEEAIAGAIAIDAGTPLIVTEGNYLLLERGAWAGVRPLLDEAWYVEVDEARRLERLLARHMRFGRSRESALAWIAQTDEPNARLIESTRVRADRVVHIA
ncbi:MAG TPA: nucleoside/nucleotide kinase family protein [Ideonella sp.]|nr:nucleoside/nucleotide kinase family protein [Ideonella sp.]